mgnify:CR=1 FL=1
MPAYRSWCSLPQGERTREQRLLFTATLPNINILYLGCSVLLLLDRTYLSRFWCGLATSSPSCGCSRTG